MTISLQERSAAATGRAASQVTKQPMFCFETAIKMFFFSSFVYTHYDGVRQGELLQHCRRPLFYPMMMS